MRKLYFPETVDTDMTKHRIEMNGYYSRDYGRVAQRELVEAVEAENLFYEEKEQQKALRRKHLKSRMIEYRKHNGFGWNKARLAKVCGFDKYEQRIHGETDFIREYWMEEAG